MKWHKYVGLAILGISALVISKINYDVLIRIIEAIKSVPV